MNNVKCCNSHFLLCSDFQQCVGWILTFYVNSDIGSLSSYIWTFCFWLDQTFGIISYSQNQPFAFNRHLALTHKWPLYSAEVRRFWKHWRGGEQCYVSAWLLSYFSHLVAKGLKHLAVELLRITWINTGLKNDGGINLITVSIEPC